MGYTQKVYTFLLHVHLLLRLYGLLLFLGKFNEYFMDIGLENIFRKFYLKKKKKNQFPKGTLFSVGRFPYMSYIEGVIWFVIVDTWSECCALLVQPMLSLDLLPSKANFAMLNLSL